MKILLVNPPDDLASLLGGGAAFISNLEPLGLLYIAAMCREAGHDVSVIDAYAERLSRDQLRERIVQIAPRIIGFTSFTSNGGFLYEFPRMLKKEFPDLTVVLGNVHAMVYAEQYLRNGCCDAVVHGEGEVPFLELVKATEACRSWDSTPSISFLRDGEMVTTSAPYFVEDLSTIPFPARDLVPQERYNIGSISNFTLYGGNPNSPKKHMFTSRGCPNRCTFCVVHHGIKPRFHPVERAVDEMEFLLREYGSDYIFFMDSLFLSSRNRVLELCREIRKRGLEFKWGCEAHVRFIDRELVKTMEEAGCTDMNFGIESGVQSLLDAVQKGIKLEQVETAIRTVRNESRIHAIGLFILGLPGETPQDSLQTIEFAKRLPLDMAQFSILTPYPGSPLFNELKNRGEIDTGLREDGSIDTSVWLRYSAYISYTDNDPIWTTPEQTPAGLKALQKKALRSFYLRLRQFLVQAKRVRAANFGMILRAFIDTFF